MLKRYRMVFLLVTVAVLGWLNVQPLLGWGKNGAGEADGIVKPAERNSADALALAEPVTGQPGKVILSLPEHLSRPPLQTNDKDPFVPNLPPVVVAKASPPKPVEVMPVAPPPPEPPPLNLTYAGRFRAPDGTQVVYANLADTSVTLSPGLTLANGYRVESISDNAVQLSYPPLQTTARLDLPAPQKYETR